MITLTINGERHTLDLHPDMPLLWVLRDRLNLTGTKFGCGRALCGACTVALDGRAARACAVRAGDAEGHAVTTIEGVRGPVAEAVIAAWQGLDVVQCGYCQPGQIMAAIALLAATKAPSDADIDAGMAGNICRCGIYGRIRRAIHDAAKALA